MTNSEKPTSPTQWQSVDTGAYDSKWAQMEKDGQSIHGEADFVSRFEPTTVLDGGCGTGRVAIELARRGCEVVGVDLDEPFIQTARSKAPEIDFHLADLATVDLQRPFDVIALPGNVMIFVAPGTESAVVHNLAKHLAPDGRLIAGFQLDHGLTVTAYKEMCSHAGLELEEHWSTWDRQPAHSNTNYAVMVHQRSAQ